MIRNLFKFTPSIILSATIFMLWEVLVRVLEVPDWFLPPPSLILRELFLSIDIILGHLLTTSIEVLLGLALSVIVAINFSL